MELKEAVRKYRSRESAALKAVNMPRAKEILGRLDYLYGITDLVSDADYTTIISCSTHSFYYHTKSTGGTRKWSFSPTKKQLEESKGRVDLLRGYQEQKWQSVLKSFAGNDPFFAVGYSKLHSSKSRSFQFEADFAEEINHLNYAAHINTDLLAAVSKVFVPQIIFSGNRSLYIAFYAAQEISREVWVQFFERVCRHLIFGGKYDVHTFKGSGLRLPLSLHQKTHNICRFLGCETRKDVEERLFQIEPSQVTEADLVALSERLGWDAPEAVPTVAEVEAQEEEPAPLPSIHTSSLYNTLTPSSCISPHPLVLFDTNYACSSNKSPEVYYCDRSSRKDEYRGLIESGIPKGQGIGYIMQTDFVRYCLHYFPTIGEDPIAALEDVVCLGTDPETAKSRLENLRKMLDIVKGSTGVRQRNSQKASECLAAYTEKAKQRHRKSFRLSLYASALHYILATFSPGQEFALSVEGLARTLGTDIKTSSRVIDYFCTVFPVLEIRNARYSFGGGSKGICRKFILAAVFPTEIRTK